MLSDFDNAGTSGKCFDEYVRLYARERLVIKPPEDRIDLSIQGQRINDWLKDNGTAENIHIEFIRRSSQFVPNSENPGEAKNLLEELREYEPSFGAWSTSRNHNNRP